MPDESFLSISEMCDKFGVTARTVRFYEAKELIFPRRVGQRRLFSKSDCARMKLILRGKRFGFSLEEIRQLLNLYKRGPEQKRQFEETYNLATKRLSDLERKQEELGRIISELKEQIRMGERMIKSLALQEELN